MTKLGLCLLVLCVASSEARADILEGFDSLGGNDVLLEKAKALNPETRVQVVQDRIVSRRMRVELAPEFSSVVGGDAYNSTHNIGANMHFHITPKWSVGIKYNYSFNQLRPEAQTLIHDRKITSDGPIVPDIDYPKQQYMALMNWYPVYGKMNLHDLGVAHFDVYGLLGGGQVELRSGQSPTYTLGGGVGFWISQHISARTELRYQAYQVRRIGVEEELKTTVMSFQMGYML